MQQLVNNVLQITLSPKGAELQSIIHTNTHLEYLWNANPNFWSKKSPVLFPIVGGLKNNTYTYNGNSYQLGRHGFARDSVFAIHEQTPTSITYVLHSNEQTLRVYPFSFAFYVSYAIDGNTLACTYTVVNTGQEALYFSCGAHPAFKVPLVEGTAFTDWFLQFNQTENANIYPLTADGLVKEQSVPCLQNTNQLALHKPLFYGDALVFKELQSTAISILSNKTAHGLTMHFQGFPYYGIWSFKDADFVCLEPWCGIADGEHTNGDLQAKEGINMLAAQSTWTRTWRVELF
jgi:galactose mutarotase-like enzyme